MGSDISLSKAVRANLLSLQNTAEMMNKTQNRLATGNKVNSALDNPSSFFTASALNSRAADMSNLLDSMASGIKVIEAANNGITALTKNLESMQSTLRQARQDKSFQTQSFEVTDKSVINFGGGRFDLGAAIKLADAEAKPGVNASLTSIGTAAYVGPQSTAESVQGAGARTVLSGLTGLPATSEITVAGSEITIGADTSAAGIAATIQAQLDIDATGQYRVMAGAAGSPNDGKIIIETVDTSAPAAEVTFATGTTEAVKGAVTFNFDDLPNKVTVGTQELETGSNFDTFFANLKAGEKAGGYVATADADNNITLTAREYGVEAPAISGVPNAGTPGSAATTTFGVTLPPTADTSFTVAGQTVNLVATADAGSASSYEFSIDVSSAGAGGTISIGGEDVTIPAITGTAADQAAIQGALDTFFLSEEGGDGAWSAAVAADGTVTVTSTANTGAVPPPVVDGTLTGVDATVTGATTGDAEVDVDTEASVISKIEAALADANVTGFSVTMDAGTVSITADAPSAATAVEVAGAGATTPVAVDGVAPNGAASSATTTFGITLPPAADTSFTVAGEPVNLVAGSASSYEFSIDVSSAGAGGTISIGGEDVTIPAITGTAADQAAIQGALDTFFLSEEGGDGAWSAAVAADGTVTVTSTANTGAVPPPVVDGTLTGVDATVTGATTGDAADTEASAIGKIEAALTAANVTGFSVTMDAGTVSITADAPGVTTAVEVAGAGATTPVAVDGAAQTTGAVRTAFVAGVSTKTEEAAQDTFTVSYDGKQADVSVTGLKLGAGPLDRLNWQSDTVASINATLEGKGIKGVEAKFDDAGKLSLVSKEAEAKTLVIGGKDGNRLFGDDTFSIGSAAETGLNATKTTDKFVEFINKKFGGEVRASNDNGKLRIENLSTQELNIGVDKNGNGAVDTVKIDGNTVRANLSKQFNELRDQLDKLSDDASFNGINLLRGDKLKITFNESGSSSIDIQARDKDGNVRGINASNLNIDTLVAEDLDTDEKIDAFLATLSSALTELRTQASSFGSNLSSVENRQSFTKNMINTLETGAANLTLADTNEEAANLLALQTRQQLSSSALSMASQQDQAVLQLLR